MEYEIAPKENFSLGLKELWQFRELFYFFTWRDIKIKYKQTILGLLWVILQPLLMMLIFTFFFGRALNVPSSDIPYPLFVLSGLIIWNIFSSGVSTAGNSMITNANIIKKIYFPRLIIPLSAVLVSLFDFLISFIILIVVLFIYRPHLDVFRLIVFIPTGVLVAVLATFGVGTLLAALNIKYRDFRYIIPFMIQAMLFITPIIYPVSIVSSKLLKLLVVINPMYAPVQLFRSAFSGEAIQPSYMLMSVASALFLFIAGVFYFRKTEAYFADIA